MQNNYMNSNLKNLDLPPSLSLNSLRRRGQSLPRKVPLFSLILGGGSLRSFAISSPQASSFKKQTP